VGPTSPVNTVCEYSNTIKPKETNGLSSNTQFGQTGKLRGPIAGLQNSFWMSYTSASGSPCEYTVPRTRKNDENRKIGLRKFQKSSKTRKNHPKSEKRTPYLQAKLRRLQFEIPPDTPSRVHRPPTPNPACPHLPRPSVQYVDVILLG
jgi:hypothetical protein